MNIGKDISKRHESSRKDFMGKYFGTNGVRGKFDFLTPELAMDIAKAIGIYFKRGRIVVARDARLTGECLSYSVVAGLQSVGCEVLDLDYASAPAAEFTVKKLKADGLIIITASHNPPEWNALKVVDGDGVTVSSERAVEIEKLIGKCENAGWEQVGRHKLVDSHQVIDRYMGAILEHVDKAKIMRRKPKIVLDYGNGTALIVAPIFFRGLECNAVSINEKMDGRFPGRNSEPTKDNVKELIEQVRKERADCGIAWDGDADRVIFVDEKGEYVVGDKVFALSVLWKLSDMKKKAGLLDKMLGGKPSAIVTTVATSKAAEDVAARFGAKTIYTKIGAPYLSEEMAKGKAVIGGEEVGGVIWPELSLAKDGLLTAAKMVEAVCEKKLSEWISELPVYFNEKTKIECDAAGKEQIVNGMREYVKKNGLKAIEVDGVRINFDGDCWVIVRASGTENYVRVFAEAKTQEKAKELMMKYEKIAKEFLKGKEIIT